MTTRRSVYWMRFSEGATVLAAAAGSVSRLLIPSIREGEEGQERTGYTVTRLLVTLFLRGATVNDLVASVGIIVQPEDVAVTAVDPVDDPHADWLWREEFVAGSSTAGPGNMIMRDLRSQRKVRTTDHEIFFYVFNRSASVLQVHRSGAVLVKRA